MLKTTFFIIFFNFSFNFAFNSWTETLLAAGDFTPGHADKFVVTPNAQTPEMETGEDLSRNASDSSGVQISLELNQDFVRNYQNKG